MPKYYTTDELAEIYQVTRQTINNWNKDGLPYLKIGRTVRYDLNEVYTWVQEQTKTYKEGLK